MKIIQPSLFETNERKKIGVSIKSSTEFSETEDRLIKLSQLDDLSEYASWTAEGTNKELAYATHGAFRYFGKFPPVIAAHIITDYTNEGEHVLDPMSGSGTTGVECLLLNRHATLNDINPLSLLLARVKTKYISASRLNGAINIIGSLYYNSNYEFTLFNPIGLRNPKHWFLEETIVSLSKIRHIIFSHFEGEVQEYLLTAFASTIRRVSRATTQQGRLFLDVETAVADAYPIFYKRAQLILKGVSSLPQGSDGEIKIECRNIMETYDSTSTLLHELAILHPPYFNNYKYSSINSLELSWLGFDHADVRKNEVREYFKIGKPDKAMIYVEDIIKSIINLVPRIKVNGTLALMIGDTYIKGQFIPITRMIMDGILPLGQLSVQHVALRMPKYTEASWASSQRRDGNNVGITLSDYVIILRRDK